MQSALGVLKLTIRTTKLLWINRVITKSITEEVANPFRDHWNSSLLSLETKLE